VDLGGANPNVVIIVNLRYFLLLQSPANADGGRQITKTQKNAGRTQQLRMPQTPMVCFRTDDRGRNGDILLSLAVCDCDIVVNLRPGRMTKTT